MSRLISLLKSNHHRVAASYILAFLVVAICVVTMYLTNRWTLENQKVSGKLVNLSARQGTQSQIIALACQRSVSAKDYSDRLAARRALTAARNQYITIQRILVQGDSKGSETGNLTRELRSAYFGSKDSVCELDQEFMALVDELFVLEPGDEKASGLADEITHFSITRLLPKLEKVTSLRELQATEKISDTSRWQSLFFVLTLLVMVFEGICVFQPVLYANARIDRVANHDPLTDLPNRRCLATHARDALTLAQAQGRFIGFMHLDLDRFKAVNDTLGHGAGDQVLCHVADVLRSNLRQDQLIARIGGDEFAVLFPDVASVDELVGPAQRLIAKLDQVIPINDKKCSVGCSIGLAISDEDESDFERVLMDADIALYEAKKNGKNQVRVITEEIRGRFEYKERISKQIREGIRNSEFVPYFQPQLDRVSGAIIGVEALARWIRTDGIQEKNAAFISVADEIGLLSEIDKLILDKSLSAFVEWKELGHEIPKISLNFSFRELEEVDFVDRLTKTVREYGLSTSEVSVEILESVFLGDNNFAVKNINQLSKAGFTIELDDFGTGHTAIISLLDLAVDRIKLDRSLIRDIEFGGPGQTITRTLINLAAELDIETLGEGVETESQASQLMEMGCTNHQGFFYAMPMPADEVARWVTNFEASGLDSVLVANQDKKNESLSRESIPPVV